MAVVKANAYGHGLTEIARVLAEEGCRHFGVTDASEGQALRQTLAHAADITLLSGIFDLKDARLASAHRLTPIIYDERQLDCLKHAGFPGSVWLKVDTGMGRLGASQPEKLLKSCERAGFRIRGLLSHLACAEEPDHPLNRRQIDRFSSLCTRLGLPGSLLNSAGLSKGYAERFSCVRPGIALYGSEPIPSRPIGLKPVMQLQGRIIQIRHLPADHPISYGATFHTPAPMRVGVVSLGYGDGLPRQLSNRGEAFIQGRRYPILGRVCMDYTIIRLDDALVEAGDWVEFWGPNVTANEVARQAGTIAYELFTGVAGRVQRIIRE